MFASLGCARSATGGRVCGTATLQQRRPKRSSRIRPARPGGGNPCTTRSAEDAPQQHCRASMAARGRASTASPVSALRGRFELLGRRRGLAHRRVGLDQRADLFECEDPRRQWITVVVDDAVELGKQCRGLFIGQLKVHTADMGVLTFARECSRILPATGRIALQISARSERPENGHWGSKGLRAPPCDRGLRSSPRRRYRSPTGNEQR
jgi:hypothetical protein